MNFFTSRAARLLAAALPLLAVVGCGQGGGVSQPDAAPTIELRSSFPAAPMVGMAVTDATGRRFRLGARLDGKDRVAFAGGDLAAALPAHADLRGQMSAIADQGAIGSCTAFAIVKGMREFLVNKAGLQAEPLSAGFLYAMERLQEGTFPGDAGAGIDTGMKVLSETGTTPEADFPYATAEEQKDPAQLAAYLAMKPGPEQVERAKPFRVASIKHLTTLNNIRQELAAGNAVVIGFEVYESFTKIGPDGVAPMPKEGEKLEGGHAVLLVGYDNARKVFIVKNSWGPNWADHGYFYMPFDYVKKGLAEDAWTARLQ